MDKKLERKKFWRSLRYAVAIAVFDTTIYAAIVWNIKDYLKANPWLNLLILLVTILGFPFLMLGQVELVHRYEQHRLAKEARGIEKKKN